MKHDMELLECRPASDSPEIKVTIIYEDFASGLRAKNFAERLAEQLGCTCHLHESFWRCDLLGCHPIAAEAARASADCDYLIVALRGDRIVPLTVRQWIETQLGSSDGREMALIVLPDSEQGKQQTVEATRQHFRTVCAVKGVPFYSHAMTVLPDTHRERTTDEPAVLSPPWTPGWPEPEIQNERRHDLSHRN